MISIRSLHDHLLRHKLSIFLFLCVGGFSAMVNFGSFAILWHYFQINYQVAVSFAYALSVVVHYTLNRYLTFKNHTGNMASQIPRYLAMLATNYLITLMIVQFVVEILQFSPYIGMMSAIGVTVGISYLMSRFWVFHSANQVEEQ